MSYILNATIANCTAHNFSDAYFDYYYDNFPYYGITVSRLLLTTNLVGLAAATILFSFNGCCYGCFKPKKPLTQPTETQPLISQNRPPQSRSVWKIFSRTMKGLLATGAIVTTSVLVAKSFGWINLHDLQNPVLIAQQFLDAAYNNCTGGAV